MEKREERREKGEWRVESGENVSDGRESEIGTWNKSKVENGK